MENEINYNELFGVDAGDSSGVKGQSNADSDVISNAMDSENDTAKTDIDDNGNDGTPDAEDDVQVPETTDDDGGSDGEVQPPEENAKYAAARRKAERERDIAIEEQKKNAENYLNDAVKALNIKNPFTGKVIETKPEYDEYMAKVGEANKASFMRRSGLNEEEYRSFVDDLPEVRQAREISASAERARNEADRERAKAAVDAEIKKISAVDPTVKSVADLQSKENYKEIYARVQRGYSLYDAYVVSNHDAIVEKKIASAKQSALNSVGTKEHLTATSQRGKGSEAVPREIADMYRQLNPGATDAEISKHYNSYIKK